MMKWLCKLLCGDCEDKRTLFMQGYDYAARELMCYGQPVVARLEDRANNPFDRNEFDDGIMAALWDFEKLTKRT